MLLTCEGCGAERDVDPARPVGQYAVGDWWDRIARRRCQACRSAPAAPEAASTLPDPRSPLRGKVSHAHPTTSRVAARLVMPRAGSQRAAILDALAVAADGLTAYEAAAIIGRSPNQTATRMLELREQGWVAYVHGPDGTPAERATTAGNTGLVQILSPRRPIRMAG